MRRYLLITQLLLLVHLLLLLQPHLIIRFVRDIRLEALPLPDLKNDAASFALLVARVTRHRVPVGELHLHEGLSLGVLTQLLREAEAVAHGEVSGNLDEIARGAGSFLVDDLAVGLPQGGEDALLSTLRPGERQLEVRLEETRVAEKLRGVYALTGHRRDLSRIAMRGISDDLEVLDGHLEARERFLAQNALGAGLGEAVKHHLLDFVRVLRATGAIDEHIAAGELLVVMQSPHLLGRGRVEGELAHEGAGALLGVGGDGEIAEVALALRRAHSLEEALVHRRRGGVDAIVLVRGLRDSRLA
mmetsp:Transcript_17366/g.20931  ORF Transcript_17366/g.20931 Transcript_17366/m.20931 type:complete len:302 (-) Transcript_17366:393-1298(-)